MYVQLIHRCDNIRLCGPAGLVAAVMDDVGRMLVDDGYAVELTREEFERRLETEVQPVEAKR